MNTTTLRWLLVLLALFAYWFTAFETGRASKFTISMVQRIAEAKTGDEPAKVEALAKELGQGLRELNDATVSTFYGLHAAISAVLAALLAIEVVQNPNGAKPFLRLTTFADSRWLALGIVLLFVSWAIVSGWMSLQAFTAPDDFSNVLSENSKFIAETQRNVATKLKGVWDGIRTATVGTLIGVLYAAFAVKPKQ